MYINIVDTHSFPRIVEVMQSAKKSKRFAEAARNCKSVFFLFVDKEVYIFEDFFIAVCNCAIHSDWFIINWFIMTGNLKGCVFCFVFCLLIYTDG